MASTAYLDHAASAPVRPEVRDALLAEQPRTRQRSAEHLATAWHQMYRLGVVPDYEPTRASSATPSSRATSRTARG